MKICYLANANSVHTAKWANYLSKSHEVRILSFEPGANLDPKIEVEILGPKLPMGAHYFASSFEARKLLQRERPDIVHAHYGSGYGTLARLLNFHPYVLSIWGSDVFGFPRQSPLHRRLLRKNLASADRICSTSEFMTEEARRYCRQSISVTPFGVDCDLFRPTRERGLDEKELVIGTVKALEPKYGIDYLISAFALVAKKYRGKRKLRLVIAGDGSLRGSLVKLAKQLGVAKDTEFVGQVPHSNVPDLLNTFSVFAALSTEESFGVAVLEASACELPVVVTSVGGLPEVVLHGETGIIVPPRSAEAAARVFEELIENCCLCHRLGKVGREFVLDKYEWEKNAKLMEEVYSTLLDHGLNANLAI